MDPQAGSSFIPKKPLAGESRSGLNGLFFSIALLLFLASLGAAGAAFAYQQYINTAIEAKKVSLRKVEEAFEPDVIETLVRTDNRIREMQGLLAKHTAPSAVFNLLSQITLQTVRYNRFAYATDTDGQTTIELAGVANSFSSVALQSDQFGASKHLNNVVFSGITINPTGQVDFTVKANVEPATISYAATILEPSNTPTQLQEDPQPVGQPTTPTASSTPAATTTTP